MRRGIILIVLLAQMSSYAQELKDFGIDYMMRGQICAGSSIKDSNALGGFGASSHIPKSITRSEPIFHGNGFYLKIDDSKQVTYAKKYNGHKLYIVNKSDSIVTLNASDSRLYVVAEVFVKDKWMPIEYLPSSWCGNSYHQVFISPNEYWDFVIPKFSGKIKTKLRYRLELTNGSFLYSNEIVTHINKKQLSNKNEYQPKSIMDPYND